MVTRYPTTGAAHGPLPENWRCYAWSPSGEPPLRRLGVRALAGVWWVEADGLEPLSFANGAQAEQQARALARGFAFAGFDAAIRVHDVRQALVGTVMYYAREQSLPPASQDRYPWAVRKAIRPRDGRAAATI